MESSCPHLGADLSHAEIEDYEPDGEEEGEHVVEKVAVCPWHRFVILFCQERGLWV